MLEKQKILIVDDREENLMALQVVLGNLDAEIVEANSGSEALAAIKENDFSLALIDVMMPVMDGYELAEQIRKDKKAMAMPIIFVSAAYGDEMQIFKGYDVGAIDYIVKPFNQRMLDSKVRNFLKMDWYRKQQQMNDEHLKVLEREREAALKAETEERTKSEKIMLLAREKTARVEELENEISSLAARYRNSETSVTGKMYGAVTLIDDFPDIYNELVNRYKETMTMALEKQMFNVTHDITGKLAKIVEVLGFYGTGPRDVVDIHSKGLKENMVSSDTTEKKKAYHEEGWLMVVETMGLLVSYYRKRATLGGVPKKKS